MWFANWGWKWEGISWMPICEGACSWVQECPCMNVLSVDGHRAWGMKGDTGCQGLFERLAPREPRMEMLKGQSREQQQIKRPLQDRSTGKINSINQTPGHLGSRLYVLLECNKPGGAFSRFLSHLKLSTSNFGMKIPICPLLQQLGLLLTVRHLEKDIWLPSKCSTKCKTDQRVSATVTNIWLVHYGKQLVARIFQQFEMKLLPKKTAEQEDTHGRHKAVPQDASEKLFDRKSDCSR